MFNNSAYLSLIYLLLLRFVCGWHKSWPTNPHNAIEIFPDLCRYVPHTQTSLSVTYKLFLFKHYVSKILFYYVYNTCMYCSFKWSRTFNYSYLFVRTGCVSLDDLELLFPLNKIFWYFLFHVYKKFIIRVVYTDTFWQKIIKFTWYNEIYEPPPPIPSKENVLIRARKISLLVNREVLCVHEQWKLNSLTKLHGKLNIRSTIH